MNKKDAIKDCISKKFDLRYNNITGKLEISVTGSQEFSEVSVDNLKEIIKELKSNGIKASRNDIYNAFEANTFTHRKNEQHEEIEMYLQTIMETRFNVIKQKPEYRLIEEQDFKPATKYFINSINRQLRAMSLKSSAAYLNELFFSDFSPECNPVREYFDNLPEYRAFEKDYIAELASTVECENSERWNEYLKRWLVAAVSNVMVEERCTNHTMLVLTGTQGKFKTTWIENLCPPEIKNYLYTGKIDPEKKDIETLIAECFMINIDDQLRELNKKDENALKNFITVNVVKYRRPYDVFIQEYPHLASFIGSINGKEFLTDPTGNRRFLPFEALNIDIECAQKIEIGRVWAQAYKLYKEKYRYWFNTEEIEELNRENSGFQVISSEEQLLLKYFEVPESRQNATHFLQPAEILSYIASRVAGIKINNKRLGEALTKHNFEKWRQTENNIQKWVYSVRDRETLL